MMRARAGSHVAVALALWVSACGEGKAPDARKAAPPVTPAVPTRPPTRSADLSGVVRGIVKLASGAELPLAALPKGRLIVSPPAPCSPLGASDRKLVAQSPDTQGLSPVHLAVTQMTAVPERGPITHEVKIVDCRLTPTLLGAMKGDKVRVTNESDSPVLPVVPGDSMMQALLKGQTRDFTLKRLGPLRITCGFGAFCGESTLVTVAHPLYAVSDEKGQYEIKGIPLGQKVMLHAWHPLFEVSSVPVQLTTQEHEKTVELTLTPRPAPSEPKEKPSAAEKKAGADVVVR